MGVSRTGRTNAASNRQATSSRAHPTVRVEPDWRMLPPLLRRSPFRPDLLTRTRERRIGLLRQVVAEGLIEQSVEWARNAPALRRAFGLHAHGALAAEPHRWAQFHEPQITRGFRHFLSTGPAEIQRRRAQAMVAAIWGDRMPVGFEAEASTASAEEGRIDLAVVLTGPDGRRIGAIVEAKFKHRLTARQLQRYRQRATARWQLAPEDRRLTVVMPSLDAVSRRFLKRNPEWRFLSWERLLVRLDNALDAPIDDEDFRRFRRTVWLRAYGD